LRMRSTPMSAFVNFPAARTASSTAMNAERTASSSSLAKRGLRQIAAGGDRPEIKHGLGVTADTAIDLLAERSSAYVT
jgi:hypothetical protein